jgi:hypothetical protein
MLHTAKTQPATFFAVCARLIGPEVKVTVERSLPGNYRHPIGPTCVSFYRPSSKPCLMLPIGRQARYSGSPCVP